MRVKKFLYVKNPEAFFFFWEVGFVLHRFIAFYFHFSFLYFICPRVITTGLDLTHNTNVMKQQTFNKAPVITGHLAVFGEGQAAKRCVLQSNRALCYTYSWTLMAPRQGFGPAKSHRH